MREWVNGGTGERVRSMPDYKLQQSPCNKHRGQLSMKHRGQSSMSPPRPDSGQNAGGPTPLPRLVGVLIPNSASVTLPRRWGWHVTQARVGWHSAEETHVKGEKGGGPKGVPEGRTHGWRDRWR